MFRLLSKQVLKPMRVYHHPLQLHHLTKSISTTSRCNIDKGDSTGDKSLPDPASYFTKQYFDDLEQTKAVMNTKLCLLQEGQARLENKLEMKFDRVEKKIDTLHGRVMTSMYCFLGGCVFLICIC
ncbi:hypothetical protein L873DRAFT_1805362 [Choiromyces venosus 120613-1]|uniref:t-SNARE coiled-coil homology domain-containing protein n=1 Tax=Choiromyces venosus 120613-1 TaxID=1336337 RepID=A0A3N4JPN1_9PEZI|nr:hypothetical protein L873DRAFT_1805362 [Choiromyces venosus 120613-1]